MSRVDGVMVNGEKVNGFIDGFLADESGAITVDWVALTSGILLLGIMVVYSIFNGGVASLTGSMNETLAGTLSVSESDPSGTGDGGSGDGTRTGNASDQACIVTSKFTVCMGPK